ncbi:conserved Plasmodium protein, unknown function [Plasmodium knowlesi strain H]|uniref:PH domain-containing protein n=3 Tax=Plasmodium knowlesi TaxID=5850 RepID=A0A5K1U7T9_PLAKH|nr:conserved protein, unknown function [Plasmodium knowlesi strain H]OTN64849.1 Uncharacterized protein PKNOH_S120157800 [Plasmodium knowlesi]CAA9988434.1 conserved protein, unknown function [Plasmodium knowlesi strain H]SBO19875.1 conserved Plasmodium protein, unknown function [Plasmodium knowlesi strain H]SBO20420.1 conserved Plasmodium protein, unknown function [Plasmodium knowlesi strain H]VVS77908.1 conserved protein, unknown function [Plasmodium knowlesi strain H]|eukprot:XP_002259415.1 hypothetical protein, conserved in Plasmodium species [Plasmodium knowlesi strain H]
MSDPSKKSKDSVDPLLKLKEEREKLIQWSLKLKNNNSSFLISEKLDAERKYSSDDSLGVEASDSRIRKGQVRSTRWNINAGKRADQFLDGVSSHEVDNDEDGEAAGSDHLAYHDDDHHNANKNERRNRSKINLSGSVDHTRSFNVLTRDNISEEEHKNIRSNIRKNNNKKKEIDIYGDGSSYEQNSQDEEYSVGRKYEEKNHHTRKNRNNKIEEHISDQSSEGSFGPKSSHIKMSKRVRNEYDNFSPHVHTEENFFKIPMREEVKGSGLVAPNEVQNKEGVENRHSDEAFPNMNTTNQKRKIKLTRKVKAREVKNNANYFLNSNGLKILTPVEFERSEIGYDANNKRHRHTRNFSHCKSSNESVHTFLPGASPINARDNFSSTTLQSNSNEHIPISNDGKLSGTKLKYKKNNKLSTLLEEKVHILEQKKELLNDKIKDLHDNTYTLMDAQERDNLTIQHYELIIKNLESKYNKLFNMYQELDEHRISYVDAYREKQTKIENLCAIMQIKSEESLKLTEEMNLLKKKNEEIQGQIYEYIKDIEDKEVVLNKKKEECVNLKNALEKANAENADLTCRLNEVSTQLEEALNQNKVLQEENNNINHKYKTMSKSGDITNNFFIPKIENLVDIINKLLEIFKSNEENILNYVDFFKENSSTIQEKLADNGNICDDVIRLLNVNLVNSIVDTFKQREKEHTEQKEKMGIIFDDQILKMYETNINNVEVANKYIVELRNKLMSVLLQRNNLKKRTLLFSTAQGRLNDRPIIKELKKINAGTLLHKCKYHSFTHKPVPIFMKIMDSRFITWTRDVKGKAGFKRRKLIDIKDVISIDYGLKSTPVYWLIEKHNKKSLEKKKIQPSQFYNNAHGIHPCKCFTLRTRERTYDFFSKDEEAIATWVVGLGVLCYQYNKSANIQSRSEFVVKKAQLKLQLHCIKRNINYTTLWKEAIERTQEQQS